MIQQLIKMTLFEQSKFEEALEALTKGDRNHIEKMVIDECERLNMPSQLKTILFNKFNIKTNENNSNQLQGEESSHKRRDDARGSELYCGGAEIVLRKGSFGEPKRLIKS